MALKPQVRHSFPAWRIFVYGVEVTNDVTSCNTNNTDARKPNLAEFVLSSDNDRYIVTSEDIWALYNDIHKRAIQPDVTPTEEKSSSARKRIHDDIKRKVLESKVNERVPGVKQPGLSDPPQDPLLADQGVVPAFSGDVARFPLQVGHCIFHTGDPVRIFWRDPFDATGWYFEATGTVSDWQESVEVNGLRTVTIIVEDATRPLRLARLALNPAIYDINAITDPKFDEVIRNFRTELFTDKSLVESIWSLIFGTAPQDTQFVEPPKPYTQYRYGANGPKTAIQLSDTAQRGVGLFNKEHSDVLTYPGATSLFKRVSQTILNYASGVADSIPSSIPSPRSILEQWQKVIDAKVPTALEDLEPLCIPEKWAEYKSILNGKNAFDIITIIGEHPEIFPVDFGRVLFFVPSDLGAGSNIDIFLKDFQGIPEQSEMLTRLQIIYGIVDRLNFCFYATPRGDLVCEMPLYSFTPEDFGSYRDRYTFGIEDMLSYGSHFQHDKVRTILQADFSVIENLKATGLQGRLWIQPKVIAVHSLIPQFGLVAEKAEPWHFAKSPEAMKYYCDLKLSQLNSDAWTQNVRTVMRMGLGPNRPCYFEARDFIATLRSVSNSIRWQKDGDVSQTLAVNYRRGWTGQVDKDGRTHIYEPYGGIMADPTAIAVLFKTKTNPVETSTKEVSPVGTTQSGSTVSDTMSATEQKQLDSNLAYSREFQDAIVAKFEATIGGKVTRSDLIGSEYRTPSEQKILVERAKRTGGVAAKDSLHMSGLAFDIPQSKLDALYKSRRGSSGFVQPTAAQEKQMIKDAMGGAAKWIDYHQGHWHVQLRPDELHRRIRYEDGE